MRQIYLLLFIALFSFGVAAQGSTPWTLEKAVSHALENNLQVKRLDNIAEIARLNLEQANKAHLPTANGSTNVGMQFGRTIDPTTNAFNAQTIGFQGYQLNAGVTIYNGGLIRNNRIQSELNLAAAEMDAKVTGNNIGLQVANSYLTIVLLKEQLANAQAQLQLTNDQLNNTDRLINAGALPAAQRYDLLAQQAANERTIVDLENQVQSAVLTLRILLEVDFDEEFNVATPEIDLAEAELFDTYSVSEVYTAARGVQPTVMAAELRRDAATQGIEIAKAGLRPTISLFGSLSTNFSSLSKDFSNPDISDIQIGLGDAVPVVINGEEATLAQFEVKGDPTFPKLGYFNQLNRNFGQSVGMSMSVPIYSQGRNKLNVQRAEVQRLNAELDIEQADNQLRNDVELALTNLRGAQQTYRAAQASQQAAQAAYDNAQRSFRAGAANSFDLVTATNRLEQAQTELTRSKYQLIFNRQVIRFYLGQGYALD